MRHANAPVSAPTSSALDSGAQPAVTTPAVARPSMITLRELAPAAQIVDEHEAREVSDHPLFVRLRSEPVSLEALWFLVANMNAGISPNFVRWLGLTIARLPDFRVASLIAKQLDDELGNGDFQSIHSVLLERFVAGLAHWRPERPGQNLLHAGERLGQRASAVFESLQPYEAVGGLIVAEIFAKKMDRCLGDEIRRQDLVAPEALRWLEIHEVLEVDHAEDSASLAALVPDQGDALAATWRGARELWDAMWGFLDDVAELAFEPRAA
jgi:pyrroloquinoline quinone (PQQ) biosynthesis protein C